VVVAIVQRSQGRLNRLGLSRLVSPLSSASPTFAYRSITQCKNQINVAAIHLLVYDFGVDPSFSRIGLPGSRSNLVAVCHFVNGTLTSMPQGPENSL
jgi:hypothetical protein